MLIAFHIFAHFFCCYLSFVDLKEFLVYLYTVSFRYCKYFLESVISLLTLPILFCIKQNTKFWCNYIQQIFAFQVFHT